MRPCTDITFYKTFFLFILARLWRCSACVSPSTRTIIDCVIGSRRFDAGRPFLFWVDKLFLPPAKTSSEADHVFLSCSHSSHPGLPAHGRCQCYACRCCPYGLWSASSGRECPGAPRRRLPPSSRPSCSYCLHDLLWFRRLKLSLQPSSGSNMPLVLGIAALAAGGGHHFLAEFSFHYD